MQTNPRHTKVTARQQCVVPFLSLSLVILISLFLSACNEQAKTPLEVSQTFWQAVQEKDSDALEKIIVPGSFQGEIGADTILSVSKVSFGKIMIDGDQSRVETEVTIDSDQPMMVPINTRLVKENEQWKVDYQATMDAVSMPGQMTLFLRELKNFGEKFSEELNHSMKELDQAMPEIEKEIAEMGEQIRERVPELKQRFDEMADEIRKSLEDSLSELESEDSPDEESKAVESEEQSYSI